MNETANYEISSEFIGRSSGYSPTAAGLNDLRTVTTVDWLELALCHIGGGRRTPSSFLPPSALGHPRVELAALQDRRECLSACCDEVESPDVLDVMQVSVAGFYIDVRSSLLVHHSAKISEALSMVRDAAVCQVSFETFIS